MPKKKIKTDSRKKLAGYQTKLDRHDELFLPEEPNVSSILKIPGTGQTEETDDLFNHPLHSTALSAYEEEEEVGKNQYSVLDRSTNLSDLEPKKKNITERKSHCTLKTRVQIEDSEEEPLTGNTISKKNAQSHVNDNVSPKMEVDDQDSKKDSKQPRKVTSRDTKLNIILHAFEKVTAEYKQGVTLQTCREAVDIFCNGFRDQLSDAAADAEELKNTRLQNGKMIRKTNKQRRRLIDIKEKLIRTEPELKKLEKEHDKLKEKISCLRNAVQFITDLKDLQQYNNEKKNSQEKTVYGVSSLPALLVDSRRILGAEGHFRNINKKLQESLSMQNKYP